MCVWICVDMCGYVFFVRAIWVVFGEGGCFCIVCVMCALCVHFECVYEPARVIFADCCSVLCFCFHGCVDSGHGIKPYFFVINCINLSSCRDSWTWVDASRQWLSIKANADVNKTVTDFCRHHGLGSSLEQPVCTGLLQRLQSSYPTLRAASTNSMGTTVRIPVTIDPCLTYRFVLQDTHKASSADSMSWSSTSRVEAIELDVFDDSMGLAKEYLEDERLGFDQCLVC